MYYIYVLQSIEYSTKQYTGFTQNLKQRLADHNSGKNISTKKSCPWKIIYYCAISSKIKALSFEKYLKSPSGKAFLSKHIF